MRKTQIEKLMVSQNKGKTWYEEEIDIRQIDPKMTTLKDGDWIKKDDITYEINAIKELSEENKNNTMINGFAKFEGLLYASVIQ